MTREEVAGWLDRYVEAWRRYDREAIGDLFAADAVCRYHPYDSPIRGRDAVIESWLGEGGHEGAPERDAPGTYEASYEPVAVDGDVAVATGVTRYRDQPGGDVSEVFHNCFVMRFDAEGRCAEFTEWFMRQPDA